jgi:hypothetical protein
LDENPYKHLQDFEEICATLIISGMNRETVKWKAIPFSCHGSGVILKDQFYFTFFLLSKIIDLHNKVLNFLRRKERVWEQPGPDTVNLLC